MASKLIEFYAGLAAINIISRDKNVPVRGLTNLNTKVSRGNLPLRLLLPVGARAEGKNIMSVDLGGHHRTAAWSITDLFLLADATEGNGLEDFSEDLIEYVVRYEAAINDHRQPLKGFTIENLALATGVYEWPARSNAWRFGCEAVLGVREIIE